MTFSKNLMEKVNSFVINIKFLITLWKLEEVQRDTNNSALKNCKSSPHTNFINLASLKPDVEIFIYLFCRG